MDLKYVLDSLSNRDKIYTVNLEITGLCNAHCSYCHFYLKHDRKSVNYHIPIQQFKDYCEFIKYWSNYSGGETNYRFSGGDPITLKNELFERAELAYEITGISPFLLTHGKSLKEEWFRRASDSAFEAIYLSIENPTLPDLGAQNPERTIELVRHFDTKNVPIKLGVCVIPNNQFKNLLQICDWFYDRIGYIPPIAEINYGAYKSPTEQEWVQLQHSLELVLDKYYGKTHLNLFHSVSPELSYDGLDPYVFSLGLINNFDITSSNIPDKAIDLAESLKNKNYPFLNCNKKNCNWSDFCINTKWYWQSDSNNSKVKKTKDYCRFKRILNDSYYRVLVDSSHYDTSTKIELS